jgi:hypothetical protein
MVGCTTGSRGEVPGERKPVIRDDEGNKNKSPVFIFNCLKREDNKDTLCTVLGEFVNVVVHINEVSNNTVSTFESHYLSDSL